MDLEQVLALFLLLGAGQGAFLSVLLLARRENAAANRILAGAMAAFAVFLVEVALYAGNRYRDFPHLIGISQAVVFLFGPVIYLYARAVSDDAPRGGRRLLHFVPAIVVVLFYVPFYAKSGAAKAAFVDALLRDGPPLDVRIIERLKLVHGVIYTWATFGVLRRYRRRLEDNFSTLDRINLRWLRNVLVGAMVLWGVAVAQSGLDALGIHLLDTGPSPVSVLLVVFVYLIGYLGLRQPEVLWPPAGPVPSAPPPAGRDDMDPPAPRKYRKSGLDPVRAATLQDELLALMDERKPHLDPDLTLQQLADRLDASPHNVSEIINSRLEKSFHDFVNEYRVGEARNLLADPARANHTVLAVALEAGFRSKSTFNKIFRRFAGVTPSEFRRGQAAA